MKALLQDNCTAEKALLKAMGIELTIASPAECMSGASVDEFNELTLPLLRAFIRVRLFDNGTPEKRGTFQWPKNKGKPGQGDDCILGLAFSLRSKPVIAKVPTIPELPIPATIASPLVVPILAAVGHTNGAGGAKPSEILSDAEWRRIVQSS